jgi:hypothetical protein
MSHVVINSARLIPDTTAVIPGPARGDLQRELKFVLPLPRARIALELLKALCRRDARYPAAIVSTIYYDTPDLRLLFEKLDSDYLKTKVRLRWYCPIAGAGGAGTSFLEVKSRVGSMREKARVVAPLAPDWLDGAELDDPALAAVVGCASSLGVELPGPLLPALLLRYRRYRFVEPLSGTRVSLDFDIEARRGRPGLFRSGAPAFLDDAVIEVKGESEDLPRVLRPLGHLGIRRAAFSKYAAAGLAVLRVQH